MNEAVFEIKEFLDRKVKLYNTESYIASDPIQIPHRYSKKEDIEIAAFLTATIAWGQRKSIIKNALFLMQLLDDSPYDFVLNASEAEIQNLTQFVHRTFNGFDAAFFLHSLRNIYQHHNGLENVFALVSSLRCSRS